MKLFAPKSRSQGDKGWVENFIKAQGEALSLVHSSMSHEEFLSHCVEALPIPLSQRDTRRQRVVRAIRRMHERGDLPFGVQGGVFVFH